jgi:hypothetical protein
MSISYGWIFDGGIWITIPKEEMRTFPKEAQQRKYQQKQLADATTNLVCFHSLSH